MDEPDSKATLSTPRLSARTHSPTMTLPEGGGQLPVRIEEAPIETPPELAGFTIGKPIGRGGFAVVWGAVRDEDGAAIALKVGHTDTPLTNERFRRDAEAMISVGPPHAPRIYASGRLNDGRPYIAMERVAGSTLAARLTELTEPLRLEAALAAADAVLAALEAAHAKGVVHRDLKPDNIILDASGSRATLLDFGLAKSAAPDAVDITRPGTIIGTPEYMAPEQLRGDRLDVRTDLYAFGVILYQLLTQRRPFEGDVATIEHGHLALRPPRPSEIVPIPEEIEAIVLWCLAKEPARRPATATALRRSLATAGVGAITKSMRVTDETSRQSPRSSARPVKLLAESQRPMVVLVAEIEGGATHVSATVSRRSGIIARQRANRYVCVFSGTDTANPVSAALATARELIARFNARTALHLASLTLRPQEGGPPAIYGRAVEKPESWLPGEAWSGLLVTTDLARALPEEEGISAAASAASAFIPLSPAIREASEKIHETAPPSIAPPSKDPIGGGSVSTAKQLPLFGEQNVLEAMASSARVTFESGCAGLVTLIGDNGLGKSRLAGEAASIAGRIRPSATIALFRASPPLAGEVAPTARELLAWLLGVQGAPPADAKALCVEKLGSAMAEEVWRAVASVLGWASSQEGLDIDTEAASFGLMRAIAEGLRRKASEGPLAVVLDDAHWADDIVLDALEYAAVEGASCPLWVVMTAHPRFENVRRLWGSRAERYDRLELQPLPEAPAMKLAAELLLPVEYPPAAILRRLAEWAGGNPACLVDLVRALKRAGIVRKRPNTDSYYVATAELEQLPPQPAWQWLAVRRLDALPPELAACVRLCSVLGVRFTRDEVEQVQDAVDRAGDAGTPIDVGVGLGALADWKILERAGGRWSFQSAAFQDAVYKLLEPAHRKRIHRHAFEVWQGILEANEAAANNARTERISWVDGYDPSQNRGDRTSWDGWDKGGPERPELHDEKRRPGGGGGRARRKDVLERLARHAGACGAAREAAEAHLALAQSAMELNRHVEADHHYSAAINFLDEGDARRRAIALTKRAKARYQLYRASDALDDLKSARDIAQELGDDALVAEIFLEEATALDHANDYAESAERVEMARPIVERLDDQALTVRYWVALGRTRWRQERVNETIELLSRGADGAKANGDYGTRVVALLSLSCSLAVAGRIDDAIARYIEVIELCMKVEDRLHLGMAYLNRVLLWLARKSLREGIRDLRRAIQLARDVGNPWLERAATANTAELLHWSGEHDEAVTLARRSCVLAERFVERPVYEDWLLLARIQLMRGQYSSTRTALRKIADRCSPASASPTALAFFRTIELVLRELYVPASGPNGVPSSLPGSSAEELSSGSQPGMRWSGDGDWEDVLAKAQSSLLAEELLEILYWRARIALHRGRLSEAAAALQQAKEPLAGSPGFHARFKQLEQGFQTAAAS
jgi:serine/threonine protein kinase/tetratricopeptide (TPR) repeat protein